jgi:2-(1,2-epoxy-1,2-dihydrophenyl)acetyl-CoA isomerase
MTDAVLVERRGSVAILELNRPDIRNALNGELKAELEQVVPAVLRDKSVRSVILMGKGTAFCAGGDLSTMGDRSPVSMRVRMQRAHQWILQLAMADVPLITAVNGSAMGAGLGLALLGDVIIAADNARFQAGFPKVGAVPDFGLPLTLPRIIGMNRAKDMLLTNRAVDAEEALSIGLVSRIVPADRLREEALALAEMLANGPTLAFSLTKTLLRVAQNATTSHYLEIEANAQAVAYASSDFGEGVDAFLNRRPPAFKGG